MNYTLDTDGLILRVPAHEVDQFRRWLNDEYSGIDQAFNEEMYGLVLQLRLYQRDA